MTVNGDTDTRIIKAPTTIDLAQRIDRLEQRIESLERDVAAFKTLLTPAQPKPPSDTGKQLIKIILKKLAEAAAEPPKNAP